MKASKLFNVSLGVIFITMISIPLITVNRTAGQISVAENRALASFPSLKTVEGTFNTQIIKEYEAWFNDNLGFRDEFLKLNTSLQYKLFGNLTRTDTIVGKNDWLYYVTPEIIKDYQHLNLPTSQQLELWGDSFKLINEYLDEKDIPFITMINLDKKTIYPENYPSSIYKIGEVSRTDILVDYLSSKEKLDIFTPKKALFEAKKLQTLYSPRYDNAHWNNYGAFIGYLELMERVKKYYPNIKILSWDDFEITPYEREFNLYDVVRFKETDYAFKLKKESNAVQIKDKFKDLNLIHSDLSVSYTNKDPNLPKVLILGDSYLYNFLTPYISESFSEMNFIYTDNINRLKSFIELYKPDIVIYENVERMLDGTLPSIVESSESFKSYNSYVNLPVSSNPSFWLDYSNGEFVKSQNEVEVDTSKKLTNFVGWALDSQEMSTATNVFLKVGNKYYSGEYGLPRPSVSEYFKNSNLYNSGFSININTEELIDAGEIEFIIISKDKEHQYKPIKIKIVEK
ncbi:MULTISPECIES: hypothetical protein [Paenibacillus]|uniref:hypothetical protein n=1 Tax=Paenibacillus TaxID=44249 RepID=UPI00096FE141|nr:hypothetical protein [Paenibacillus odorifer]OMD97707.1 hypothetical protein BSK67_00080 [Paenibacillus odorifer]